MLEITAFAKAVGGDISPRGNPRILAIDEATGIIVGIEIESSGWKNVLEKLGRMKGVGITPANRQETLEFGKQKDGG